jgi:membrane protein DedA with SNARE-associated domain
MTSPALPGIFGALAPTLNQYGYLAVGFFITVEDFGIPVPGETILIAAALYAGTGKMSAVAVGLVGFFAALIGDNIGFAIGHFGGRALALRFGKYVFLTSERLDRAEAFFDRQGGKIIVVARFIEGLRQANGIVAGITGMHWRRFIAFNAIGAALWVGVWVSLGYLAGNHIIAIYNQITRYSLYVLIAAVLAVAALVAWHLRRRAKRRTAPVPETAEASGPGSASPTGARPARNGFPETPDGAQDSPNAARDMPNGAGPAPGEACPMPNEPHEIPNETGQERDGTVGGSRPPEPEREHRPGRPAAAGERAKPPGGQESS